MKPFGAISGPFGRLTREAARAAREARRSWSPAGWTVAASLALAAAAPAVIGPAGLASLASGLLIATSAVGLNFAVGLAGMPSLAQGAFAGLGAFGAAVLQVKHGWDPVAAWTAGVALALSAGLVVGAGAVRLRGAVVAVATWSVTWLVGFAVVAFPGLTGGARGLTLGEEAIRIPAVGTFLRFTPGVEFELALAMLALAVSAYWAMDRSSVGSALALAGREPEHAISLGIAAGRLQLGAFAASAAVGGAAGALAVQVAGVADPGSFGPLLSVELFVAVLLGGEGTVLGPVVGAASLAAIGPAANAIGSAAGVSAERFEPVIAAALLIAALLIGRGGLVRRTTAVLDRTRRHRRPPAPAWRTDVRVADAAQRGGGGSAILEIRSVSKAFGGVAALDGVSMTVRQGEIRALIGPNGSGKTTLLRVLGGTLRPDGGAVAFDGRDLSALPPSARAKAGLVRTPPRTLVAPRLSVLDHVAAGATVRRRFGGAARTLLATPLARDETAKTRARATEVLEAFGLEDLASYPVERLPGTEQRLVMLATAFATEPTVLMLDEPSSGMSLAEARHLAAVLAELRSRGTTLLVVEHDMRIVRRLADRVTVLDAGRVIADGHPDEISGDPLVIEAYLGPRGL